MAAAFIISIRGTVTQAILLGLSATFSHTLIVWLVAGIGLMYGRNWYTEANEAYFQLASAAVIFLIAVWMVHRIYKERLERKPKHADPHTHGTHGKHSHAFETGFTEAHHHHDVHHVHEGLHLGDPNFHDAHQRAHAEEITQRFATREVTTWQIILFGLTGGLIPCPSAITVLILCLQIKRVALGFFLVLGFGIGLAVTMVVTGVLASLGFRHASKRFGKLSEFFQYAPYLASAFVIFLSLFIGVHAWMRIHA